MCVCECVCVCVSVYVLGICGYGYMSVYGMYMYTCKDVTREVHVHVQWDYVFWTPFEAEESVLISEVSCFLGLYTGVWDSQMCPGVRCPG